MPADIDSLVDAKWILGGAFADTAVAARLYEERGFSRADMPFCTHVVTFPEA